MISPACSSISEVGGGVGLLEPADKALFAEAAHTAPCTCRQLRKPPPFFIELDVLSSAPVKSTPQPSLFLKKSLKNISILSIHEHKLTCCMVEGLRRQVGGSTFQEGQSGLALPFGVPSTATTPQLSPTIPSSPSAANTPPTTSRVQLSPALPSPLSAVHTPPIASRVLVPLTPPPHPNSPEPTSMSPYLIPSPPTHQYASTIPLLLECVERNSAAAISEPQGSAPPPSTSSCCE